MMQVVVTASRRRWSMYWRRRVVFQVPECWEDMGADRLKWFNRINRMHPDTARMKLFRSVVPRRWRWGMSAEDKAAIYNLLKWYEIKSDCSNPPITEYKHRGVRYVLPKPNGDNMTAAEFAVCDDLFKKVVEQGSQQALNQLTATIFREQDEDEDAAAARGDVRVMFHSVDESDRRIKKMGKVPEQMQQQALLYFSGLKAWVHRVYGPWIFEEPDEDENGEPVPPSSTDGPNFGWWGILQAVAEIGTFGSNEDTKQSNLHEVCIFLVRKRQESERLKSLTTPIKSSSHDDDIH